MSRGHVLRNGVWVSPDDDLVWREESFGERPDMDEVLVGGPEDPEVCDSCQ